MLQLDGFETVSFGTQKQKERLVPLFFICIWVHILIEFLCEGSLFSGMGFTSSFCKQDKL